MWEMQNVQLKVQYTILLSLPLSLMTATSLARRWMTESAPSSSQLLKYTHPVRKLREKAFIKYDVRLFQRGLLPPLTLGDGCGQRASKQVAVSSLPPLQQTVQTLHWHSHWHCMEHTVGNSTQWHNSELLLFNVIGGESLVTTVMFTYIV